MGADPNPAKRRAAALLLALLTLSIGEASADIFRCSDGDGVSFRDKPCSGKQKQAKIGAAKAPYAGCFQVEHSARWEGGSGAGTWRIQVAPADTGYLFKETIAIVDGQPQAPEAANVPMHNANPDEVEAAAQQLAMKVTSGMVLELPETAQRKDGPRRVYGMFNAWDADGRLRFVAYLPFVNGYLQRIACP